METYLKYTLITIILISFLISATNIVIAYDNINIERCTIETYNAMNERTYAKIFVGEEHSNENVKIQIYYSYNKEKLNQGKKVGVTVDNSGCIEVYSAKPLKKYPNHAKINIYNSQGDKLLDSKSVKLAASKGTQTFYAPEKSSSSSSNSVKTSSSNKNNYNSKSSQTYIGNKNTGKFHYPGCRSVSQMKNSNKVYLSSRNDAISRGYSSCAICNP